MERTMLNHFIINAANMAALMAKASLTWEVCYHRQRVPLLCCIRTGVFFLASTKLLRFIITYPRGNSQYFQTVVTIPMRNNPRNTPGLPWIFLRDTIRTLGLRPNWSIGILEFWNNGWAGAGGSVCHCPLLTNPSHPLSRLHPPPPLVSFYRSCTPYFSRYPHILWFLFLWHTINFSLYLLNKKSSLYRFWQVKKRHIVSHPHTG